MPPLPSPPTPKNDPWLRQELIAPWWKIIYVIGVMLGLGIILGAFYSTRHPSGTFYQRFSDYFFLKNAAFESGFLALFLFFLRYRGWTTADFRIRIGWWTGLCGIGLFILTMFGVYFVNHTTNILYHHFRGTMVGDWITLFVPKRPGIALHSIPLHWMTILGFTLLNAFYEELIYMGYVFNQLAQKIRSGQGMAPDVISPADRPYLPRHGANPADRIVEHYFRPVVSLPRKTLAVDPGPLPDRFSIAGHVQNHLRRI